MSEDERFKSFVFCVRFGIKNAAFLFLKSPRTELTGALELCRRTSDYAQ